MAMLAGLQVAAATVLSPDEREVAEGYFVRWKDTLKHHQRLPGDHKGNKLHPLLLEGRRHRRRQVDLIR